MGYTATGIEMPEDAVALWGDQTMPSVDMLRAKLIRYASNIYAVAHAYPETALESNLDYDLRQYLTFFYAYLKAHRLELMPFVEDYVTNL